jgi:hypothetical protein
VDGTLSPSSGNVTMNTDHWLWAFGQPITGTDFASFITAPNDPVVIPYPQFYANRPTSQTVRVSDPYCALQSSVIAYPHSFLGSFPMPPVIGAPLPRSILRGVALKDFWFADPRQNPTLNGACGTAEDMHDAFSESATRIQRLGADHVHVTTWIEVADATTPTPVLDPATIIIPNSELSFITSTAKAAGLDVWLDINIPSGDENGVSLSTTPSQQWMASFLSQYTQFIVQTAQMAETNGVKAMMLNWNDFFPDLTPYEDVYIATMTSALAQVRQVFHGMILFNDVLGGDLKAAALYKGVDAIIVGAGAPLTAAENQNLTFGTVKANFKYMFTWFARQYATVTTPLVMSALIQSHRNFLQTGWVEDCCCVSGYDSAGNLVSCVQNTLQTDFSVQAIGYEALFEAAMESGLNFMSFDPYGYWYVDVILPDDSFPNTGQTIRNKPAEAIVQRWFEK